MVYGWYRTEKQSGYLSEGPSIAVVQQAFPISLYEEQVSQEKMFEEHLRSSRKFINSGCDLLVWSESMAPKGLNSEWMTLLSKMPDEKWKGEHAKMLKVQADIKKLLGELKCPLLTGGSTIHPEPAEDKSKLDLLRRNSALWFSQSGRIDKMYSKRRLVPFSEYVPFKEGWPWLHRTLRGVIPAGMPQLQPGPSWTRFHLTRGDKQWTLASPICFEGTFPDVCSNLVVRNGVKVTDVLINLSNDGWFVWKYGDRPYRDSSEHAQHLVQYYFRAVENRVPVVRCVNTGISASIDSNGRETARIARHGATMVPGAMLLGARKSDDSAPASEVETGYQIAPRVLVDSRVSLYSTLGDWFAWMLVAAAALLTGACVWRNRQDKKG